MAGYSARGAVDESLVYMVQSLSTHGDIILVMDCDVPAPELDKLRTYVLHADAHRHGEYDFGSYKRAYIYARDTAILSKYDYIYMINDSVYGPTRPIGPYFETMESFGVPVFGLVCNPHHERPHIQSWFIGMRRDTVCTDWFDRFITSVRPQRDKGAITYLYEQGFTKLITAQNIAYRCIFSVPGRSICIAMVCHLLKRHRSPDTMDAWGARSDMYYPTRIKTYAMQFCRPRAIRWAMNI